MNRAETFAFKRPSFDDIDLGAPLTRPYRERALVQFESALSIEWWRGYHTGVDLANSLGEACRDLEAERLLANDANYIEEVRKAAIRAEQQRCLRILQQHVPENEASRNAIRDICGNVVAPDMRPSKSP